MTFAAALLLLLAAGSADPAVVLTIPAEHRLIEGVATDGATIWTSSVVDRKILASRDGRLTVLALPDGVGAPLGIAWDAGRRRLWIAANCPELPELKGCTGAALLAIDASGAVKARLRPAGEGKFTPGDVSVWQDQVFVSDSGNGAVWRCRGDCTALEPVIAPRTGRASAQGSAVYDEGRRLLVADYALGLISVDLATGGETRILMEDGNPLRGVDGLVRTGDSFVAVRNPAVPGRVFGFRVAGDRIADLRVVVEGGAIVDPTQIAVDGQRLLLVADSQWSAHLPRTDGSTPPPQKPTPIVAIEP